MSAQNETDAANRPAAETKATGPTAMQVVLITAAVLGAVALAAYQFLFCASCWA